VKIPDSFSHLLFYFFSHIIMFPFLHIVFSINILVRGFCKVNAVF
jgi:hypothetical protein